LLELCALFMGALVSVLPPDLADESVLAEAPVLAEALALLSEGEELPDFALEVALELLVPLFEELEELIVLPPSFAVSEVLPPEPAVF